MPGANEFGFDHIGYLVVVVLYLSVLKQLGKKIRIKQVDRRRKANVSVCKTVFLKICLVFALAAKLRFNGLVHIIVHSVVKIAVIDRKILLRAKRKDRVVGHDIGVYQLAKLIVKFLCISLAKRRIFTVFCLKTELI